MWVAVEQLVAESGRLIAVTGLASGPGRYSALALKFALGTLYLHCDEDTDEILVDVLDSEIDFPAVEHDALTDLMGMTLEYAWEMKNHRGYVDAFQLRLVDRERREETRQFEVGASAMDVRRIVT